MDTRGDHHSYGWDTAHADCSHEYLAPCLDELLNAEQPKKVLDVGCGNGAMARALERKYEMSAFDASADGIEQARSTGSSVHFEVASVYDENLGELLGRDFDAAYSLEVVEHLYYPRRLFSAARQCLKPNGLFIVSTPYHGYWKNLALAVTNGWDAHLHTHWDGGHIKFFSKSTLTSLGQEAGFELERFEGVGRVSYLWKSMVLSFRMR